MSKKKNKEFNYTRQGSIDDENFLLLAYKLDTIQKAISESETSSITIDLTETNEKLDNIKEVIEDLDKNVADILEQMKELLFMEVNVNG